MKKIIMFAAAAMMLSIVSCKSKIQQEANYQVIPLPAEIIADTTANFTLDESTVIAYPADNDTLKRNAELLAEYLKTLTDLDLKLTTEAPESNAIVLTSNLDNDNREAYRLTVDGKLINIDGASAAGNFYGIQTLRKSIPSQAYQTVVFPGVTINDQPRFGYRGAMLDVSRHFFPADSVKAFIDMLALHNINTMHWHISDDQGWRIEIKKYPELTEKGSTRKGTMIGKDFESNDSVAYGGFYTQEQARDIVKYAADRHITIIPEIDLPGHMLAALTAYPELGCTGGPYELWSRWGISDDVLCAGNDSVYSFLDGVLTEICEIFPSKLIHLGGDECPKARWENCPKCQAKIAELGLKSDAHSTAGQKLQTYVMSRAAETLARHGRQMIGWDEILEGGATEGAVVMSWRGEEAAVEAARLGHDAILTPTNYCYFDYYQSLDQDGEPLAIGGYVPVEKVYSLEPVNSSLTADEAKHILGAQANLWTEYIKDFWHVQYMELPRLAALSEVQWCAPDKRDYVDFTRRLPQMLRQYDAEGYHYATHLFDVQTTLASAGDRQAIVATFATVDDAPIHYTLDGTEPTEQSALYESPIDITETFVIKAAAFRPQGRSRVYADSVSFNKATSCEVELANAPHSRYNGPANQLTDGRFGTPAFNLGPWLGFEGTDLVATIKLAKEQEISSVTLRTLVDTENWIFDATNIVVEVSADGKTFTKVAEEAIAPLEKVTSLIEQHEVKFAPVKAAYVRLTAGCVKSIPDWHGAKGLAGFLFVDEIMID